MNLNKKYLTFNACLQNSPFSIDCIQKLLYIKNKHYYVYNLHIEVILSLYIYIYSIHIYKIYTVYKVYTVYSINLYIIYFDSIVNFGTTLNVIIKPVELYIKYDKRDY